LISERLISAQKDLGKNVAASFMGLSFFIVLHTSLFSLPVVTLLHRSYECHFASTFVLVWRAISMYTKSLKFSLASISLEPTELRVWVPRFISTKKLILYLVDPFSLRFCVVSLLVP
jgi:hypothetical protein